MRTDRRRPAGLPAGLEGVLPAGADARGLARAGRMAAASPARHAAQALAARHDDVPRAAGAGRQPGPGRADRRQRQPLVAQQPHGPQPGAAPSRTSTALAFPVSPDLNFSNRPVRTRMPGGVGGVRSAMTGPYPDFVAQRASASAPSRPICLDSSSSSRDRPIRANSPMVPHLITALTGPINELEQRILESLPAIERWFRLEWMEHTPPFYYLGRPAQRRLQARAGRHQPVPRRLQQPDAPRCCRSRCRRRWRRSRRSAPRRRTCC